MTTAAEGRGEPGSENGFGLRASEEAAAEREDVGVIVLAAVAGGSYVVAEGGADTRDLIRGHAGADARAVNDYSSRGLAAGNALRHGDGDVGIVGWYFFVDTDVDHREALLGEDGKQRALHLETAVVRADGDGAIRAGLRELLSHGEFTQGYAALAREVTG